MEREAYTKGNLIFRDFEDLIKAGKITVDINFKDSGEPQMSLKEWKDNELNMLLMKKWGLLKEGHAKEREDEEGNRPSMAKDMDLDEEADHPGQSCDEAHPGEDHPVEEAAVDVARSRGQLHKALDPEELRRAIGDEPEAGEWPVAEPGTMPPADNRGTGLGAAPGGAEERHFGPGADTYVGPALGRGMLDKKKLGAPPPVGRRIRDPRDLQRTTTRVPAVNVREGRPQKISVREAKEITRRIMERVRKEGR
jgi:hypothetical protein